MYVWQLRLRKDTKPCVCVCVCVCVRVTQGDELDARIRKAEKEVAALEATLIQLVSANGTFTATYKKTDPKAAYAEQATLRYGITYTPTHSVLHE